MNAVLGKKLGHGLLEVSSHLPESSCLADKGA
jgi:hypothetical protein